MKLNHTLVGCMAATISFSTLASEGIFYEHNTWKYPPKIGVSTSLGLHTIGFSDATAEPTYGSFCLMASTA